jgi:hypothetical protein
VLWANWRGVHHRRFIIAHYALDAARVNMGAPGRSDAEPDGTPSPPWIMQDLQNK